MELALRRTSSRRRRIKPPHPGFWWALFGLLMDAAWLAFWFVRLASGMASGDGPEISGAAVGVAIFLKYILRGIRGAIRGIPLGPMEGSWPKFRRELRRWLEDE